MNNFIANRLRALLESTALTNKILDKISASGIESLSTMERNYLDNQSAGVEDKETEDLLSVDMGHTFNKTLDSGMTFKFIYGKTEREDGEVVHMGNFYIGDDDLYHCVIGYTENLIFNYYQLYAQDKPVNVESEKADNDLNTFFQEVGNKINQTLN